MADSFLKKLLNLFSGSSGFEYSYKEFMQMPEEAIEELAQLGGMLETPLKVEPPKQFPSGGARHLSLTEPDPELEFILKKDANLTGYALKSLFPFNFDPPRIYLPPDAKVSEGFQSFLKKQALFKFTYTINENRCRITLPAIDRPQKLLVVGDSVAFGCLVNDDASAPSFLQGMLGQDLQVINAGVAGYAAHNAAKMAEHWAGKQNFRGLVYIACQNDFMFGPKGGPTPLERAKRDLALFKPLSERFNNKILIFFHTYMEYNLAHLFADQGWSEQSMQQSEELRTNLPKICSDLGLAYSDWSNLVAQYVKRKATSNATFGLYVDHCHWSPTGNRLAAQAIHEILQAKGFI